MSELNERFKKSAQEAQNLPSRPDNDTMLRLYALYKQATNGDVSGKRPGGFDMVGKAKWDAWSKQKGKSQATAMQGYIDLVEQLKMKG